VSRTRGPVITERISAQTESWGSGGQLLARRLMAHVMARARSARAGATTAGQSALRLGRSGGAGDENRTRMTSLEDETLHAVARRFPYMQRKGLAMTSHE
jgi:hypothetical protein